MSILDVDLESKITQTKSSALKTQPSPGFTSSSLVRLVARFPDRLIVTNPARMPTDHQAQFSDLENSAQDLARKDPYRLLQDISAMGMGWSDISRLIGVSVQAVRKWRNHEPIAAENRSKIAELLAFLQLLEKVPVSDPVGWLETPVKDGYVLRYIDLYEQGRADLLLKLANRLIDTENAMKELSPDWSERYLAKHEVFQAGDGQLSIRQRK